jgi:UDP-glucose 4-epimerase
LTDNAKTDSFFKAHKDIRGVIHFAALKSVGESVEKPMMYYRNNISSLCNILEAMIQNGIENLVFSSSCTVYGQPEQLPVSENAPIQAPESPYANTKRISEEMIADATKVAPLKTIVLRYFNPIGAHDSAIIGELPLGIPDNLMPYITQTAIGIRDCLKVFGSDYSTPDGTPIRDYIHVTDLAKAHVAAIERIIRNKMKKNVEFFNLGTGRGYSVLEVIRSFEKVSGIQLNYKIVGRRPGDIEKVWADTSFANRELNWRAERSLDEMTLSAWNWEKRLAGKS